MIGMFGKDLGLRFVKSFKKNSHKNILTFYIATRNVKVSIIIIFFIILFLIITIRFMNLCGFMYRTYIFNDDCKNWEDERRMVIDALVFLYFINYFLTIFFTFYIISNNFYYYLNKKLTKKKKFIQKIYNILFTLYHINYFLVPFKTQKPQLKPLPNIPYVKWFSCWVSR
jgi:hypothetical protein